MTPATQALAARVLKLREAAGRAELAKAQHQHASRAAHEAALIDEIARERDAVGHALPLGQADALYTTWRDTAASRLTAARSDAEAAGAACDVLREALADTLRTCRGFETFLARHAAEHARLAARRDPLLALMSLPRNAAG